MTATKVSSDVTYLAAGDVDLAGAWDKFWSAISGDLSGILDIITVVGVALVIGSIIAYFWRKRRQGGSMMQDSNTVVWVMALGAILCAPQIIFPLMLKLFDQIINAGINILNIGG